MKTTYAYAKYHPGVNPSHPGFKTRPPHDVFPEDIECVLEPTNGKGAIFIGNLEAAESLTTLKSTPPLTQNSTSPPSSQPAKTCTSATRRITCPTPCTSREKTTKTTT